MDACDPSASAGEASTASKDAVGSSLLRPSAQLHLLDLPTDLLLEVLRGSPRSATCTCRTFRTLIDGAQKALSLRPGPSSSQRHLQDPSPLLRSLSSLTALTVGSVKSEPSGFFTNRPTPWYPSLADMHVLTDAAITAVGACQQLQSLDLHGCELHCGIRTLSSLTALRSLDLGVCQHSTCVAPLAHCHLLTSLTWAGVVTSLGPLAALTALASLICPNSQYTNLSPLQPCAASLTRLHLPQSSIPDLAQLSGHTRLTSLQCRCADNLHTLLPLALFGASLTHLTLWECPLLNLRPLASCRCLRELDLMFDWLTAHQLTPLTSCTALAALSLNQCRRVTSLAPLSSLSHSLCHLDLTSCSLDDVSSLAPFTALTYLDISFNYTTLLIELVSCKLLKTLRAVDFGNTRARAEDLELLQQRLPQLQLDMDYD